uniref:ATPase domain-containing protein n=1 Tax=Mucochytrium quahogii TaxID=96639 RepID=A0A7S2RIP1_9STRA|mmetsp:Transcript_9519/g.17948  ORF Transcript_9519/g.17948 Transcript_9519/m.17948 type:complete len:524 (-) Transcript_9519:155-1726(-)|eukprot:CAMPEP_0203750622 /NCGR_PEP_ID=MMETSP0098-20131031/4832_1 /ASSEMBLY_ACC=CAM_ASM_000208 /TAXON_ID=96639 /ORGANISM=" , Strain NY0313808BC1" /LENGTH=523 /DNA_ID=CAMNT_0050640011 /DNA_START=239 /DNA_END=1810 /DNA_ORIENTATION=-
MSEEASVLVDSVLMFGKKTLATGVGIGTVVSSLYLVRRSRRMQVAAMKYKMGKWAKTEGRLAPHDVAPRNKFQVKVDRELELGVLRHHLLNSKPKMGFVTGPESCGKSWLVLETLRDVDNVLKVDLHKEQVSVGSAGASELLDHLVRRSGYYYPTSILSDLGLISARPSGETRQGTNPLGNPRREVELALNYLEHAFKQLKEESGQNPCIFIDELHSLRGNALKSNDFVRFLQWAMHITDAGLANVIFVGDESTLYQLDQEHQALRQRRAHFPIDYPIVKPDLIKVALRQVDDGKIFDGAAEAKLLCESFGGQLRDMEKAIGFADNGQALQSTVSRMITETSHFVQNGCLEPILEGLTDTSDVRSLQEIYKRYMRCWKMICLFSESDEQKILHDRLVYEVFEEYGHEIDEYVEKGILRYCWPLLGSDKAHEITLKPLSPRFACAFRQLVNKPGLQKVAIDVKKQLALLKLDSEQAVMTGRINTILSIKQFLSEDGKTFNDEMEKAWATLRGNWEEYDQYTNSN